MSGLFHGQMITDGVPSVPRQPDPTLGRRTCIGKDTRSHPDSASSDRQHLSVAFTRPAVFSTGRIPSAARNGDPPSIT